MIFILPMVRMLNRLIVLLIVLVKYSNLALVLVKDKSASSVSSSACNMSATHGSCAAYNCGARSGIVSLKLAILLMVLMLLLVMILQRGNVSYIRDETLLSERTALGSGAAYGIGTANGHAISYGIQ